MKTAELVKIDPKATALRIVEALAGGLTKAAELYRQYVADGGDPMELRRHAPVSSDLWRTLDDVACGRLDVRTITLPGRVYNAVRLLPKAAQAAVIEKGVEVALPGGDMIRVQAPELTGEQARQVIGPDGVRTPSEQAAWIKKNVATAKLAPAPVQFEVKGCTLRIYQPCALTVHDLHRILAQME